MKKDSGSTPKSRRNGIYLRAAALMEKGYTGGCCGIFCEVSRPGHASSICEPHKEKFEALFKPDAARTYWWGSPPVGQDERVLALCFMAAITERP